MTFKNFCRWTALAHAGAARGPVRGGREEGREREGGRGTRKEEERSGRAQRKTRTPLLDVRNNDNNVSE